ncbi:MAG: AI-2E family transporter [Verrucomicrobia bacterium]|nr:MAG: AI-2E family transporter [Verrucomicrobiota bacterium]
MSDISSNKYPTEFQKKALWSAATGVSILVVGALLVGLLLLVGRIFGFLQPILIPLIVAGIVAYLLDPVVCMFERRGFSRLKSVLFVFASLLLGATLLVAMVLPGMARAHSSLKQAISPQTKTGEASISKQSENLTPALARALNDLRDKNLDNPIGWLLTKEGEKEIITEGNEPRSLEYFSQTRIGLMLYNSKDAILSTGRDWISAGSTKILGFLGLVLGMIMVPVYLFFFLKDSSSIRKNWHHYVPLRASHFKTQLVDTLQEINGYLISFFRGQVLVAAIDGLLVGIALMIFGLPYGFLIGVFMALLGIIPYIGNLLCLIPACIIGYLHAQNGSAFGLSPWGYVACVVAIFVVVQQINSLVTAPKIVGDSVGLHPLTVIFSMLFWSLVLGGFIGALLAVPLSAAVKVLFRRFIWEKKIADSL